MTIPQIKTVADLEDELSRPSEHDIETMRRLPGDILILGAAGKMGPSLARLCRRAADAAGRPRRIIAVARQAVSEAGIEGIGCDMLDHAQVGRLPACPSVLYLVGRKFGSSASPELTWAINTLVPAIVAERFADSRIVAFSTGNVYPLREVPSGGSTETDPPGPVGEYAQSCLGRERVFEYYSRQRGLHCLLFRLNYAVDLRYGVLVDIARKVYAGEPVALTVPACNVIWQRDANSYALRSLEHCAAPPEILNVTGADTLSVREAAEFFVARFGRPCVYAGVPGPAALLSDSSRCRSLLGPPEVTTQQLLELVATWVSEGGASLNKATHFDVADGKF